MVSGEDKKLRAAMHDAREKSGISDYIELGRDIGPIADDLINTKNEMLYGLRSSDERQFLLDANPNRMFYSDVRDWVENVIDGFNKGLQFDVLVDKKRNIKRAVSMFLTPEKC